MISSCVQGLLCCFIVFSVLVHVHHFYKNVKKKVLFQNFVTVMYKIISCWRLSFIVFDLFRIMYFTCIRRKE